MRPTLSAIYQEKIQAIRKLMADGQPRTLDQINQTVPGYLRKAVEEMVDADELSVRRKSRNIANIYQATHWLGHAIKFNTPDVEVPTPEGVLMLQDIVIKQRAIRLSAQGKANYVCY